MNSFNYTDYYNQLNRFLIPTQTVEELEKSKEEILQKINSGVGIIIDSEDVDFKKSIIKRISKIASFGIGQQLLVELIDLNVSHPLKIQDGFSYTQSRSLLTTYGDSCFLHRTNTIAITSPKLDYVKGENDNFFWNASSTTTLFHELIHALHFIKDPVQTENHFRQSLPGFTNLEEQITIIGLQNISFSGEEVDKFCESTYRQSRGFPLRFSHKRHFSIQEIIKAHPNVSLHNFEKYFKRYLKKLINKGIKKEYFVMGLFQPTVQQKNLLGIIEACGLKVITDKEFEKICILTKLREEFYRDPCFNQFKLEALHFAMMIENNFNITSQIFLDLYKNYRERLNEGFHKYHFVIDIAEVNALQRVLIGEIQQLGVKVHNITELDDIQAQDLETMEIFDWKELQHLS